MKRILSFVILMVVVSQFKADAQDQESPLDTLTRRVAAISQNLDILNRIKISGYIQTQFQYGDSTGAGAYSGGAFAAGIDKRFMIRRGRIKAQYDAPVNDKGFSTSQYVLQIDVTEKGLTLKDAYAKFTDPWSGWFSVTMGMQNRPFGYEISYSSSMRESPERGRMSQIIFPAERDLGAMLTIQGPKTGRWNWIRLDAGLFNGTGGAGVGKDVSDFDKKKDFISHLSIARTTPSERIKYGLGVSYYDGGYRIDSVNVYSMSADAGGVKGFNLDSKKFDNWNGGLIGSRSYSKRQYYGLDAQFSIDWTPGITTIRGEYIQGKQPGASSGTTSPNSSSAITSDIYNRNFNGAYFYFLQNILQTPVQVIVKYDWYDPNTKVKGDEIGKKSSPAQANFAYTNSTDIKYNTLGLGLAYRWDANVKITAYYDLIKNEKSANLSGYTNDLKDNVITLRVQVKF